MKNILLNNTQSKNKLEDYVMTGYGHTAMPMTDENGISTATSLPLGLYLIIETKVPANVNTTVDPFFVSLPMTDKGALIGSMTYTHTLRTRQTSLILTRE